MHCRTLFGLPGSGPLGAVSLRGLLTDGRCPQALRRLSITNEIDAVECEDVGQAFRTSMILVRSKGGANKIEMYAGLLNQCQCFYAFEYVSCSIWKRARTIDKTR